MMTPEIADVPRKLLAEKIQSLQNVVSNLKANERVLLDLGSQISFLTYEGNDAFSPDGISSKRIKNSHSYLGEEHAKYPTEKVTISLSATHRQTFDFNEQTKMYVPKKPHHHTISRTLARIYSDNTFQYNRAEPHLIVNDEEIKLILQSKLQSDDYRNLVAPHFS